MSFAPIHIRLTLICAIVAVTAPSVKGGTSHLNSTERIYGLSIVWSEVKSNYIAYDEIREEWDSLYLEYLSLVEYEQSDFEYYRLLQEYCARLHDGHSKVTMPRELRNTHLRNFPVRTEFIEGKVLVADIYNDTILKAGLHCGDEITAIDGMPVIEYTQKNVRPFVSASTDQDSDIRTYVYELFRGHLDSSITLTFLDADGTELTEKFSRGLNWHLYKARPAISYRLLDGGIGLLTLNGFSDPNVTDLFDSLFDDISGTRGLIIDVRNNGGGTSSIGYHILSHIVDSSFYGTFWNSRQEIPKVKAGDNRADWFISRRKKYCAATDSIYHNPIVLLIGPRTYSAAEDFSVTFDYLDRGRIIGSRSGGSSGEPIRSDLPGGGSVSICTERNYYPDGRQFVGIGIIPDTEVYKTADDLRQGKDPVLLEAIRQLSD